MIFVKKILIEKILIVMVFIGAVFVLGCTSQHTTGSIVSEEVLFPEDLFNKDTSSDDGFSDLFSELETDSGTDIEKEETADSDVLDADVTLEVTEGDLVELKPRAEDPDGDKITFLFSSPLNNNGRWQTNEGDAGKYLVTVTATDGVSKTSKDVLIIVKPANKAPTLRCPETITVNEGETVLIECTVFDVDGPDNEIIVSYSGWMKEPVYKTTFDDSGTHAVLVTAEDFFKKQSFAEVTIIVKNVNRPPEFVSEPEDLVVMEGDLITLDYDVIDPDNDALEVFFSEPFDSKGVWKTEIGDAGTYNMFIAVTDGEFTTKKEFEVVVQLVNTAPVLKPIADITVKEGEIVNIKVDATDREGDSLTITYGGWMSSSTYQTTFDDARPLGCNEPGCTAEYFVTVTVSDGFLETSQVVTVFVEDVDRAPVFKGILG